MRQTLRHVLSKVKVCRAICGRYKCVLARFRTETISLNPCSETKAWRISMLSY